MGCSGPCCCFLLGPFVGAGGLAAHQLSVVSVIVWEEHGGDGSFSLTADVVGDDPDGAVLGCVVDGEEASIASASGQVIGGLVLWAEVPPVAFGMAIQEGSDHSAGYGGGNSGSGHHSLANLKEATELYLLPEQLTPLEATEKER
jgi:hypothetical protein